VNNTRLPKRSIVAVAAIGFSVPFLAAYDGHPSSAAAAAPVVFRPGIVAPAVRSVWPEKKNLTFVTLDDSADPTFNQLLGINTAGTIAGYYGSGAAGHPNKGYTLAPPYGQSDYTNENYPGSAQTQVTALNNKHDTAGFWVDASGNNYGFIEWNGVFTSYKDPHTGKGTVNQILGLNDAGIAVGFYVDANGMSHGFEVNQATGKFTAVVPTGLSNVTVAGINSAGDITGFGSTSSGGTIGFLRKGKAFTAFAFPNAVSTTPLGINKKDDIVGVYVDTASEMHGFLLTDPLTNAKWQSIDDPNGVGTTTINGLNDKGDMVGFYVDSAGNTDGMLIEP
jgi:hypothetical protein